MEAINMDLLTALITKNQNKAQIYAAMQEVNISCHLKFKPMNPEEILATAKRINFRQQSCKQAKPDTLGDEQCINWGFGQFKIFMWALIYSCLAHSLQFSKIDQKITQEIEQIFPLKSPNFIRYEIRLLLSYKIPQSLAWSKDEARVLEKTMRTYCGGEGDSEGVNWRFISYRIYVESGCKFFRSLNHCREKWNNHLNPIVNKMHWSAQEDLRLLELIEEHGLKWSKISKCMDQTRTEHMVKNRYNRFLRLWKAPASLSLHQIRTLIRDKIRDHSLALATTHSDSAQLVKIEEHSHEHTFQEQEEAEDTGKTMKEEVVKEEAVKEEAVKEEAVKEEAVKEEYVEGEAGNGQVRLEESENACYHVFSPYIYPLSSLHCQN